LTTSTPIYYHCAGNTVKHQYRDGIYKISDWSHIVNAHTVPGPGIIDGLREVGAPKGRGLLLLAEMSPKGTLAKGEYSQATIQMAKENQDFVMGFISTRRLVEEPDFVYMSPGVSLSSTGDALGQQYNTPHKTIFENGSDIIIVGRGIYEAQNPLETAKQYQEAGWKAYSDSLEKQKS
jgi:orotidine 5'-phosphate decarboxylase subfamily 1